MSLYTLIASALEGSGLVTDRRFIVKVCNLLNNVVGLAAQSEADASRGDAAPAEARASIIPDDSIP